MTNAQIIFNESVQLMNSGIIRGTGKFMKSIVTDQDGNEKEEVFELPEEIHTFAAWKELGRSVKKGQKAKAAFTIWKHTSRTVKDQDGNEEEKENMFMKKAFFFTIDQTEPIKEKSRG